MTNDFAERGTSPFYGGVALALWLLSLVTLWVVLALMVPPQKQLMLQLNLEIPEPTKLSLYLSDFVVTNLAVSVVMVIAGVGSCAVFAGSPGNRSIGSFFLLLALGGAMASGAIYASTRLSFVARMIEPGSVRKK